MDKFIKVKKGEEIIEIHPDALKNHQQLGWVVVEEEPEPKELPIAEEVKAQPKKKR